MILLQEQELQDIVIVFHKNTWFIMKVKIKYKFIW